MRLFMKLLLLLSLAWNWTVFANEEILVSKKIDATIVFDDSTAFWTQIERGGDCSSTLAYFRTIHVDSQGRREYLPVLGTKQYFKNSCANEDLRRDAQAQLIKSMNSKIVKGSISDYFLKVEAHYKLTLKTIEGKVILKEEMLFNSPEIATPFVYSTSKSVSSGTLSKSFCSKDNNYELIMSGSNEVELLKGVYPKNAKFSKISPRDFEFYGAYTYMYFKLLNGNQGTLDVGEYEPRGEGPVINESINLSIKSCN